MCCLRYRPLLHHRRSPLRQRQPLRQIWSQRQTRRARRLFSGRQRQLAPLVELGMFETLQKRINDGWPPARRP